VLENVGGVGSNYEGDSISTSNNAECGGGNNNAVGGVSILSSISANTNTNVYYPNQRNFTNRIGGSDNLVSLDDDKNSREEAEMNEVEYGGNNRHMNGSDPRLDSVSAIITARKLSAHAKGVTFSIGSSHSRDHISLNLEDNHDSESAGSLSGVSNSAVSAAAVSNVSSNVGARSVSRNIVMASDDECCLDGCSYNDTGSLGGKSLQHQPVTHNNPSSNSWAYGISQYDQSTSNASHFDALGVRVTENNEYNNTQKDTSKEYNLYRSEGSNLNNYKAKESTNDNVAVISNVPNKRADSLSAIKFTAW